MRWERHHIRRVIVCRNCGGHLRGNDDWICPQCRTEFVVPHEEVMKRYFTTSLVLGILGILTAFFGGGILNIVGLHYARQAKSKVLIILNTVGIVAMIAAIVWLFATGRLALEPLDM